MENWMKKFTWNTGRCKAFGKEDWVSASDKASMAFAKPAISGPRNYMTALPRKVSHVVW